jgi:hypothetical protein
MVLRAGLEPSGTRSDCEAIPDLLILWCMLSRHGDCAAIRTLSLTDYLHGRPETAEFAPQTAKRQAASSFHGLATLYQARCLAGDQ